MSTFQVIPGRGGGGKNEKVLARFGWDCITLWKPPQIETVFLIQSTAVLVKDPYARISQAKCFGGTSMGLHSSVGRY